jgi:hypothetical protein
LTVTVLFLWGAPSDERAGLYFVHTAGPCQRNLSRVRVPWDSRPYFTISDLRLPFLSPPTTRRVTVEVFDPASTRVRLLRGSQLFLITTLHAPCGKHSLCMVGKVCLQRRCISTEVIRLLLAYSLPRVYFRSCCLAMNVYPDFRASYHNMDIDNITVRRMCSSITLKS